MHVWPGCIGFSSQTDLFIIQGQATAFIKPKTELLKLYSQPCIS